jgi:molecular chaperone DnaJ
MSQSKRTHYEVLGVPHNATIEVIKAAYRRRMRETHPDAGGASASPLEVTAITEAWSTLSEPGRRALYDSSLVNPNRSVETRSSVYEQVPAFAPARFPWRFVLSLIVLGAAGVLILNAISQPAAPVGPDGLLTGGSCVSIDATQAAVEVDCAGPHDGVVQQLIGFDMTCPTDTEPYRDRQGMGVACVVRS